MKNKSRKDFKERENVPSQNLTLQKQKKLRVNPLSLYKKGLMEKKYQVVISSTYTDLINYPEA